MDTQKITFISNRPWLNEESHSRPIPTVKTIPDWYKNADRYAVNPHTGDYWQSPYDGGKIPTWKACPALYDVMGSGYVLRTPCDIEFYLENGIIKHKIAEPMYQDFVGPRDPMDQFEHPQGYYKQHFAWWIDWGILVPDGYSVLYTHPMNRFELPFMSTSGIIDNDKVNLSGTMPFFIREGWTGVLPAGTPFSQLLPFKREHWVSNVDLITDPMVLYRKNMENAEIYRKPDGGVYLREVWERRNYS